MLIGLQISRLLVSFVLWKIILKNFVKSGGISALHCSSSLSLVNFDSYVCLHTILAPFFIRLSCVFLILTISLFVLIWWVLRIFLLLYAVLGQSLQFKYSGFFSYFSSGFVCLSKFYCWLSVHLLFIILVCRYQANVDDVSTKWIIFVRICEFG